MSRRKRERNRLSYDKAAVTGLGLSTESEPPAVAGGLTKRSGFVGYVRTHRVAFAIVALALFTTTALALKYLDEDAKRKRAAGVSSRHVSKGASSWLDTVNPFASAPAPDPTPQLSKEYVYAGSRLLAVEDANALSPPPADLAVWRSSNGYFYVLGGTGSPQVYFPWGTAGDTPAPGDFDGDGKTDFSIFRPATASSSATWWIMKSSTLDTSYYTVPFGTTGDVPAPADFDGDGKTDVAVWRASDGVWYIIQSSTGGTHYATYGINGDKPAPADYDGDGRADIAVWRSSNSTFYSVNSSNSAFNGFTFTQSSTDPVSADYDGDGRADYAIRNGNNWLIRKSSNAQTDTIPWEQGTDKPVQNDYDGDGKVDIAVWRDSNGTWFIRQSASGNSLRQVQWGMTADIPVPAYYRR